jgi:primosomal protein N' (replication factor Y)
MSDPLFASARGRVLRVALPVPIDSLFDYLPPADAEGGDADWVGRRLLVPFSGRRLTGVVVETADASAHTTDRGELARAERVLDDEPVVGAALIATLREAAARALCPLGLALAPALPPGSAPRLVRELRLTARGRDALESGAARGVLRRILEQLSERPLSAVALARRLPRSAEAREALRAVERDGLARPAVAERAPAARLPQERVVALATDEDIETICGEALVRAPRQAELLRRIAATGPIATAVLGASSALRALEARGFVRFETRAIQSDVLGEAIEQPGAPPELTSEQRAAVAPIAAAVRERRSYTCLLHGVTGSGKTEVYLRAVAEALDAGRQALVLVPEITLTHQIVARLRARFGDRLAVLHSGLKPGERLEQWWRLARREVPIAVGARSALFAPLDDLGVIVVDEEHDSAYKSDEGFRYHARDLARLRAERASCPLVLGTATPALETRYAAERGELERLVLARRIAGRPLPRVEIVDLKRERERSPRGRKLILTRPLVRALEHTLSEGAQAILFLNRRGFSTQIYCFDCGFAERCKNCDVALVYHAGEGSLRCHYCDFAKPPPEVCGGCGVPDAALLGVGTERLEEELRSRLPEARIARLDRDTASRRGYTESVLRALRERQLDVLLGTQIVAKGHDFPGVRLVGVISADLGLHLPDFRAAERSFQLLTQVAGRAGRDGAPGHVVLQTFTPDHYAIEPVVDHDYERFYREELEHRRSLGYPPCGALARVVVSCEREDGAREFAESLAGVAGVAGRAQAARRERDAATVEVLGPAPAPLSRLRGRYRYQLLLKAPQRAALLVVARSVRDACARAPRDVQAVLDVDPMHML